MSSEGEDGKHECLNRGRCINKTDGKPLILYRFFDAEDNLLYIGITNNPLVRFSQHSRDKRWFRHVVRSTMEHFATRAELEAAEIAAIQTEKPKYNVKDSVAPPTNQMSVSARIGYSTSKDASTFPAPDAIASDEPTSAEREARLDELEQLLASQPVRQRRPGADLELLKKLMEESA